MPNAAPLRKTGAIGSSTAWGIIVEVIFEAGYIELYAHPRSKVKLWDDADAIARGRRPPHRRARRAYDYMAPSGRVRGARWPPTPQLLAARRVNPPLPPPTTREYHP
jgi:hypothetical protein